ncbi:hypothetical protein RYX36_003499 [Vicia faba]
MLPEIQEAFSHLLGEQNELTQELASQGMTIVYDLGHFDPSSPLSISIISATRQERNNNFNKSISDRATMETQKKQKIESEKKKRRIQKKKKSSGSLLLPSSESQFSGFPYDFPTILKSHRSISCK